VEDQDGRLSVAEAEDVLIRMIAHRERAVQQYVLMARSGMPSGNPGDDQVMLADGYGKRLASARLEMERHTYSVASFYGVHSVISGLKKSLDDYYRFVREERPGGRCGG